MNTVRAVSSRLSMTRTKWQFGVQTKGGKKWFALLSIISLRMFHVRTTYAFWDPCWLIPRSSPVPCRWSQENKRNQKRRLFDISTVEGLPTTNTWRSHSTKVSFSVYLTRVEREFCVHAIDWWRNIAPPSSYCSPCSKGRRLPLSLRSHPTRYQRRLTIQLAWHTFRNGEI